MVPPSSEQIEDGFRTFSLKVGKQPLAHMESYSRRQYFHISPRLENSTTILAFLVVDGMAGFDICDAQHWGSISAVLVNTTAYRPVAGQGLRSKQRDGGRCYARRSKHASKQ
jgi:hypothetical protein